MYLNFYNLTKKPFHITPDPEFLFLSPSHREAFAAIIYGIEQRKGFLAITGEVGVGKTTILRSYLEKSGHELHHIIYVFNAAVSFGGLLRLILEEFGAAADGDDTFVMVNRLHHLLIDEYQNSRNVVLIIDEAQNMPVETLENLRMLSNLETSEDKLLQILLVGQPELERMLDLHELRQLRQRIAVRCRIEPLTEAESQAYIQHRLAKASSLGQVIFAEGALKPIIKEARGIPRIINILCDNALVTGFGYQKKPIGLSIVKEVVAEYTGKKSGHRLRWWLAPLAAAGVAAVLLAAKLPLPQGEGEGKAALHNASGPELTRVQASLAAPPHSASPTKGEEKLEGAPPGNVPLSSGEDDLGAGPAPGSREAVMPEENKPKATPQTKENGGSPSRPVARTANSMSMVDSVPARVENQLELAASPPTASTPTASFDSSVASESEAVTRTVKDGDCILSLVRDVYGSRDKRLVEAVRQSNPHIRDLNLIRRGDLIVFPKTDQARPLP